MLTLRDFLDYCDLTDAEVAQIANTEHVPPIVAAQLALLRRHGLAPNPAELMHEQITRPTASGTEQQPRLFL